MIFSVTKKLAFFKEHFTHFPQDLMYQSYRARVHHKYLVTVLHSIKAMCDDKHGPVAEGLF